MLFFVDVSIFNGFTTWKYYMHIHAMVKKTDYIPVLGDGHQPMNRLLLLYLFVFFDYIYSTNNRISLKSNTPETMVE